MSENISNNVYSVYLTVDQYRVLAYRMPAGYNIQQANRPNKRESARNVVNFKAKKSEVSSVSSQQIRQRKKPQSDKNQKKKDLNDEELMNRAPKHFTTEQKKCYMIIQKLKRHPQANLFFRAQEGWKNNDLIPEYIDLQIIEQNVKVGLYNSILQFWADVRKIWQYSYVTSPKDSIIYNATIDMESFFDELYKDAEKPTQKNNFNDLQKKVDRLTKELTLISQQKVPTLVQNHSTKRTNQQSYHPTPAIIKKQASKTSKAQSKLEVAMSIQEKKNLGMNIRTLPAEYLKGVWEIVSEGLNVMPSNEELEFDIDTLPIRKTRLLERYVNSKLQLINRQNQRNIEQQVQNMSQSNKSNDSIKPAQQSTAQPILQQQNWQSAVQENDTAESSFSSDPDESA